MEKAEETRSRTPLVYEGVKGSAAVRIRGVGGRRSRATLHYAKSTAIATVVSFGLLLVIKLLLNLQPVWILETLPAIQRWALPQTTQGGRYSGSTVLSTDNARAINWKCIPPPPPAFLEHEAILADPVVVAALVEIEALLDSQRLQHGWKDAISINLVHASKGIFFEWYSGRNRLNESADVSPDPVDGNSIYRIASITKTFTVLEALVLGRQAQLKNFTPEISLESRLKSILPEFHLPAGFGIEAGEITLGQLGSHRAGLSRDIGELEFNSLNDIIYPPPPGPEFFADFPHNRSNEELVQLTSSTDLIWQVGEMPSYSNTGFSMLGIAVERYYSKLWNTTRTFGDIIAKDILSPLNMSHSFLGPIPPHLRNDVITPAATNFVDKLFAESHDPAGGMYASSHDLSNFLHRVLLSSKPELITGGQRLTWLKSIHQFTDGISSTGIPWETIRAVLPDFSTYNIYFKGGGLPAQTTEISALPELGYGVVVLTSLGITNEELHNGTNHSEPFGLSIQVHNIIAPALWQAYNNALIAQYVGIYVSGDGFARISFKEGTLVLEQFFARGTDVLLKWDQVIWIASGKGPRLFDVGAKLQATAFKGQFRATILYGCSWGAFDAIKTKGGWGMDKLIIDKDESGKKVLLYGPMDAKLYKVA
ncbi:hypothetical protein ABW19_dt0207632 [Dactylella cylindrospora]|nr:hypothetical protein ABW19_dt0207632 [Dactylella cylindrospora]